MFKNITTVPYGAALPPPSPRLRLGTKALIKLKDGEPRPKFGKSDCTLSKRGPPGGALNLSPINEPVCRNFLGFLPLFEIDGL